MRGIAPNKIANSIYIQRLTALLMRRSKAKKQLQNGQRCRIEIQ